MKSNARALDLFCCAGGATRGLQQAGYHVDSDELPAIAERQAA